MKDALASYLLSWTDLTSLVGNRIDWAERPQASALPSIVLHTIDGIPVYSDEGEANLNSARVQIDCWASTFPEADALALAVKPILSGTSFVDGDVEFQGSFNEDEQDSREKGAGEEDLYRVRLDFILWWNIQET